jgi:hypothetical protein
VHRRAGFEERCPADRPRRCLCVDQVG